MILYFKKLLFTLHLKYICAPGFKKRCSIKINYIMEPYSTLSKIGFIKNNYAFKFLFIAFLGIHLPLIGFISFVLFFDHSLKLNTLTFEILVFTILASFATLLLLKKMIYPIVLASKSLSDYRENRAIPSLPQEFTDEAGLLMFNIQQTILATENLLKDKKDLIFLLTNDMKDYALQPIAIAKLLMEENPSSKVLSYANQILLSSNNQLDFIETFIALLREEDEIAKEVIKVRRININEIISAVNMELQNSLADKKLTLNFETNVADLRAKITQKSLTKVLINLIENAVKFSYPSNEIIVKIDKKRGKLEISIEDKGMGFDNSKVTEMFKKFTKMGRIGTQNEKSTGIGLYLCKQIILKSEGTLVAESAGMNKGSTFTIKLKVYR
jgi:signal transduction histidine kinase